jgi:hypothetical protein
MAIQNWNALLAGTLFAVIGVLSIVGFAWNIRHGAAAYAEKIRLYNDQIGNPYSSDTRGIWILALTKLAGILGLGIIMLIGGVLFIGLAISK